MSIAKATLLTFAYILMLHVIDFGWFMEYGTTSQDIFLAIEETELTVDDYLSMVNLLEAFTFSFILLSIALFLKKAEGKHGLFIKATYAYYYGLAVIGGLLYVHAQIPLNDLYNWLGNTSYGFTLDYHLDNIYSWSSFTVIIIAPILEELFFRNYLQRKLQHRYRPFIAILVTSILFAMIHFNYYALFVEGMEVSYHHPYITFWGSLLICWLFYRSKSIGPPIVLHMSWNFMATLVW